MQELSTGGRKLDAIIEAGQNILTDGKTMPEEQVQEINDYKKFHPLIQKIKLLNLEIYYTFEYTDSDTLIFKGYSICNDFVLSDELLAQLKNTVVILGTKVPKVLYDSGFTPEINPQGEQNGLDGN